MCGEHFRAFASFAPAGTNIHCVEYFPLRMTISFKCALNKRRKLTKTRQSACVSRMVNSWPGHRIQLEHKKHMEDQSQLLADVLLEDKITDLWPEYPLPLGCTIA